MCAAQPGEHGPLCERVLAEPPPKRYDVRQLCLLGCSHEGPDGAPFDATDAFEHSWRMLSIHGTEDVIADLLSAQVFHSQHRGCGAKRTNEDHHRLRLVPNATHSFNKHLSAVGGLINDWFEGARRLGSNDLGASLGAAAGGEDSGGPRLLRGESGCDEPPSHVNLSGTRANARMLGNGVLWLAEELRNDTTVRSLDLSSNNIRHAAANALASALEVNTTLGSLELSHNNLLGNGAQTLAASLQNSKSLTRLGLKSNGIGATGAAALAVSLASNRCSLTSLNLRGNGLTAVGAASLAAALKSNTNLTELDLSENLVKETGATALAEALNTNASLTSLSLRYNGIRSAASKLAASLTSNTTLNSLDLKQNDLSQVDLIAIAAVIGRNTTLMTLELGLDASTLAAAAEEVVSINRLLERNRDRAAEAEAQVEAAVDEAWAWPREDESEAE